MDKIYDSIIVGAGPAGMSAAIYLKRSNLSFLLLDKGAPGGKLNEIGIVDNYLGFKSINGPDLAFSYFEHLLSLGIEVLYSNVISITKKDDLFYVKDTDNEYISRTVIFAGGTNKVKNTIKGEAKFNGKGVSYCAICDGSLYKNKCVAVIGNNKQALEECKYLSKIVKKVYFITDKYKDNFDNVEIINDKPLEIMGKDKVEQIVLENCNLLVKAVFMYAGETSGSDIIQIEGVKKEKGYLCVDLNMETSIPGLFAAGDVVNKKLKQISNAVGEGAEAAIAINSYLRKK